MGRLNTDLEREQTLERIEKWKRSNASRTISGVKPNDIAMAYYQELRDYFALCGMARGKSKFREDAERILFSTRVRLEGDVRGAILDITAKDTNSFRELLRQKSFGESKKQGISIRFPLTTCEPTRACGNLCYAHDVLDAAPAALIRGVINGVIGETYESGCIDAKETIARAWTAHVSRAVHAAISEAEQSDFLREPRIRFGHVGDGAALPQFCNAIGAMIVEKSHGRVRPVIYTRHSEAQKIDRKIFVVNYTLDNTSLDRERFVPSGARVVFSAFGGSTLETAAVNFLEHHRFSHSPPKGGGRLCPATTPDASARSCDGVKCDLCFRSP